MSCQLPTRAELALAAILAAGVLWLALVTWGPAALAVLRRGDTLTAILALVLAGVAGDLTRPLDLYELTVEQARQFDGVSVEGFLEAGCPADVGDGYTVVLIGHHVSPPNFGGRQRCVAAPRGRR